MTLRDIYKKSHWQVAGPTFYQLAESLHVSSRNVSFVYLIPAIEIGN